MSKSHRQIDMCGLAASPESPLSHAQAVELINKSSFGDLAEVDGADDVLGEGASLILARVAQLERDEHVAVREEEARSWLSERIRENARIANEAGWFLENGDEQHARFLMRKYVAPDILQS